VAPVEEPVKALDRISWEARRLQGLADEATTPWVRQHLRTLAQERREAADELLGLVAAMPRPVPYKRHG
jgi:hypothetical protein